MVVKMEKIARNLAKNRIHLGNLCGVLDME